MRGTMGKINVAASGVLVGAGLGQLASALAKKKPDVPAGVCCQVCPAKFAMDASLLELSEDEHRAVLTNFAGWHAARSTRADSAGALHLPLHDAASFLQLAETAGSKSTAAAERRRRDKFDIASVAVAGAGLAAGAALASGVSSLMSKKPTTTQNEFDSDIRHTATQPCCKICPADFLPPGFTPSDFLQLTERHGGVSALADAHRAVAACEAQPAGGREKSARAACYSALAEGHEALARAAGLGSDPALLEVEVSFVGNMMKSDKRKGGMGSMTCCSICSEQESVPRSFEDLTKVDAATFLEVGSRVRAMARTESGAKAVAQAQTRARARAREQVQTSRASLKSINPFANKVGANDGCCLTCSRSLMPPESIDEAVQLRRITEETRNANKESKVDGTKEGGGETRLPADGIMRPPSGENKRKDYGGKVGLTGDKAGLA